MFNSGRNRMHAKIGRSRDFSVIHLYLLIAFCLCRHGSQNCQVVRLGAASRKNNVRCFCRKYARNTRSRFLDCPLRTNTLFIERSSIAKAFLPEGLHGFNNSGVDGSRRRKIKIHPPRPAFFDGLSPFCSYFFYFPACFGFPFRFHGGIVRRSRFFAKRPLDNMSKMGTEFFLYHKSTSKFLTRIAPKKL